MSLTIRQFHVEDLTNGGMAFSGRFTSAYLTKISTCSTLIDALSEQTTVTGTPSEIDSEHSLNGSAHMSNGYIEITRNMYADASNDNIFVPDRLRIGLIRHSTGAKNAIMYAFSATATTAPASLVFKVLFANCADQTVGDYVDIDLPDNTASPSMYLVLILANDAWTNKTTEDTDLKLCSLPNDGDYFCIRPAGSNADTNSSHSINIQGFNSTYSCSSNITIAFEDWYMATADKDYDDILLLVTSVSSSENEINDTTLR
jgi:hypothetical protein